MTVTATDKAGNPTTVTHRYTVAYAFGGFFAPIDNGGVYNILRAGQGVPVKFSLGTVTLTDGVPHTALLKFKR